MKIVNKQLSNLHVSKINPFQPTCLIKQAICTPPLVIFRHPRTWGTFWSTKFWSFFCFFSLCQSGVHSSWHTGNFCSLWHTALQLLRDFCHAWVAALDVVFPPCNLAFEFDCCLWPFFGSIYMVIYCCWCLLGEGCCSPPLPTRPHCGGSASERNQEDPQEQHKVENRETFCASNTM